MEEIRKKEPKKEKKLEESVIAEDTQMIPPEEHIEQIKQESQPPEEKEVEKAVEEVTGEEELKTQKIEYGARPEYESEKKEFAPEKKDESVPAYKMDIVEEVKEKQLDWYGILPLNKDRNREEKKKLLS